MNLSKSLGTHFNHPPSTQILPPGGGTITITKFCSLLRGPWSWKCWEGWVQWIHVTPDLDWSGQFALFTWRGPHESPGAPISGKWYGLSMSGLSMSAQRLSVLSSACFSISLFYSESSDWKSKKILRHFGLLLHEGCTDGGAWRLRWYFKFLRAFIKYEAGGDKKDFLHSPPLSVFFLFFF